MKSFRKSALMNLTQSFFSSPFSEQVEFFIIPALANETFPHFQWTNVLNEAIKIDKEKSVYNTKSCPWLLYSFLKLFNFCTGKTFAYKLLNLCVLE